MSELIARMRWFPKDALLTITEDNLKKIGQKHGVTLSLEEVKGTGTRVLPGKIVVEETHQKTIETTTQSIVTVEAPSEESFRRCVRELIDTYRAPVPIWGLYGSTPRAELIANELMDQDDGW